MKSAVKFMKANNIPIEQIGNGDTFTLGEDGGVKMTVIQYHKSSWGVNDQSAMLMVQYGDRRMLFAGATRTVRSSISRRIRRKLG